MKVQEIKIEPTPFQKLSEEFQHDVYNLQIHKEVVVQDWWPDEPECTALIYVGKKKVVVLPVPFKSDPNVEKYILVSEISQGGKRELDYRAVYEVVARKYIRHVGAEFGRTVGYGIVVRQGKKPSFFGMNDLVFVERNLGKSKGKN